MVVQRRRVGRGSSAMLQFFKQIVDAAPADATVLRSRNTWGVKGSYDLTYLCDR